MGPQVSHGGWALSTDEGCCNNLVEHLEGPGSSWLGQQLPVAVANPKRLGHYRAATNAVPLSAGATAGGSAGEGAVRAALQDYLERLPEPFVMLDIESRIQERTPYVVVALQEVRAASLWGNLQVVQHPCVMNLKPAAS